MERITVVALPRLEIGKNAVKRVRKAGMVPAVLYGRSRPPQPLAIERKALLGALRTEAGRNVLIDLQVRHDGRETSDTVMIAEIQHDYLKREVMHVDLHEISLTEKVEARVPVVLTGVPDGVTAGGILEQHLRELTVRCLPTAIPEHVDADVRALYLGASLHVRDLPLIEGIELLTAPDEVIAAVVAPKEEAAPAEAAAPAEPEVLGKETPPAEGEAKAEPGARAEGKSAPTAGAAKPQGGGPARAEKKE
jgi:large subunit ribosomal protein L25